MTENLPDTNVGNIEYISRHAAIIEMMDNDVDHAQGTDGREVVQILSDIPAADVVPVVRCKECKFRDNDDFCTGRGFPCQLVPDDGFCDKGERKE